MKRLSILWQLILLILPFNNLFSRPDIEFPVKGLCIAAPFPEGMDVFIEFIKNDLTERKVNTLVVRIDYNYEYKSYPNLRNENPLSEKDVKRIVGACHENDIRLVPQINLLGHQSWANRTGKLLQEYPEFDETPHIEMPEEYKWPNDDGLYCKSYCPRHPEVHKVVFALVDEIMEVFEADAFHAGMDEVFYIGDPHCPRCRGIDPSKLFADEVRLIRDHLKQKGHKLWIWGDRLLDGRTTGMGMWEASMNNTHRAIDMIPKDVVIWDWHYNRAEPSPAYFAMKGFRVVSCSYKNAVVAEQQLKMVLQLRTSSSPELEKRVLGIAQTVWSPASRFINVLNNPGINNEIQKVVDNYNALFGMQQ